MGKQDVAEAIRNAISYMSDKHKNNNEKSVEEYMNDVTNRTNDIKNSGVAVIFGSDKPALSRAYRKKAFTMLERNIKHRPSLNKELSIFREYVPVLLKEHESLWNDSVVLAERFERYVTDSERKKYKKWSQAEDEFLIELICEEKHSILEISTIMGRTVPAIKSRITKLVGIKRLS